MNPIQTILNASSYVPATLTRKALEKINPAFGKYFSKALSYGIDVNRAIDYLSDKAQSDSQRSYKSELDKGAANNTLRPDEMASRSKLSNAEIPGKIAKGAVALGVAGALGGVSSAGFPEQNMQPEQPESKETQTELDFNSIMQKFPKLFEFVQDRVSKGASPQKAAQLARVHFISDIANLEKLTNQKFTDLAQRIFGSGSASQNEIQTNSSQDSGAREQILQGINQLSQLLQNPRK